MDAGRQAVIDRPGLDQRRDGAAGGDDRAADHHLRLLAQDFAGELDRDLRVGLVVLERELEHPSLDPARFVDQLLDQLQRLLLALADEGARPGERHDGGNLVGVGGAGWYGDRSQPQRKAARGQVSHAHLCLPDDCFAANLSVSSGTGQAVRRAGRVCVRLFVMCQRRTSPASLDRRSGGEHSAEDERV